MAMTSMHPFRLALRRAVLAAQVPMNPLDTNSFHQSTFASLSFSADQTAASTYFQRCSHREGIFYVPLSLA